MYGADWCMTGKQEGRSGRPEEDLCNSKCFDMMLAQIILLPCARVVWLVCSPSCSSKSPLSHGTPSPSPCRTRRRLYPSLSHKFYPGRHCWWTQHHRHIQTSPPVVFKRVRAHPLSPAETSHSVAVITLKTSLINSLAMVLVVSVRYTAAPISFVSLPSFPRLSKGHFDSFFRRVRQ